MSDEEDIILFHVLLIVLGFITVLVIGLFF